MPAKYSLISGTIATALMLASAPPAVAQTREQKADARAAAEAGGDAFDSGKWAEAADLFERAERLMHAPPHLLFAARAETKLGHLVEARELYLSLTRERLGDHPPKAFKDAQQMGEHELPEIEARLPYVSLAVQGAGKAPFRVTRNGTDVPTELLGVPVPINPGDYSYQAFAEGMESTPTTVKITDGARETVLLTLRAIPGWHPPAAGGAPPPPKSGSAAGAPVDAPPQDTGAKPSSGRPLLIGSISSFALGAAGIGVGAVFLSKHGTTSDEAAALFKACSAAGTCPNDTTPAAQEVSAKDDDARTQMQIAVTGLAVGGVGLIGGVTLLILDSRRDASANARLTPVIGLNYAGVRGAF